MIVYRKDIRKNCLSTVYFKVLPGKQSMAVASKGSATEITSGNQFVNPDWTEIVSSDMFRGFEQEE